MQDQEETQQFVAALADWLDQPGSLCKVFNYFMAYDLGGFNAKSVPRSRGLDTIVNLSRDKVEDFVADYVQERPVFAYRELVRAVGEEGFRRPDDNRLGDIIANLGLRDGRPRVDGQQVSLYFPASMSAAEAAALYEPASF